MKSQRKTTTPNIALTSPRHQAAIAAGEEHHYAYLYNVEDRFKDKTKEQIQETLRASAFPFAVCFEEWIGSFVLSSGIRSANAFNAREIYYLGIKKMDKRGMVGCYHYNPYKWLPTMDDFVKLKERYTIVGADNIPGATPLQDFEWQPETLIAFGSEGTGLTPTMQGLCDRMVYIPQYGSVRSLNAACAASIIMNDFVSKFRRNNGS